MPNGVVQFTDDEWNSREKQQPRYLDQGGETADGRAPAKPVAKPGVGSDLVRSTGNIISSAGSTGRDLGIPGAAAVEQYGTGLVESHPSEINSLSDMIAKPGTTVREALVEAAPQAGLSLAGATAGAAAGGAIGAPFGGVSAVPGAVVGGLIGGFTPNLVQEYGGIRQEQRKEGIDDRTRALGFATGAAAIDMLGPLESIPRKAGTRLITKAAEEGGEGLLKRAGKGALVEGSTEVAQTGLERAGADQSLTDQGALDDYAVSGVKGAVGGGGIEAVAGQRPKSTSTVNPEEGIDGSEPVDLVKPEPARTGPRNEGDTQLDLFPDAPTTSPYANVVNKAAKTHGVSASYLSTIADIESGYDPNAKNPNSTAGGLFQFTDGTWSQYGNGKDKFDPAASADAAARLTAQNKAYLTKRLGREPADWELYLAHQQGAGGAAKLLTAGDKPAVDVVGSADAVVNNGGNADMTASQFAQLWKTRYEAKAGEQVLPAQLSQDPKDKAPVYDAAVDIATLSEPFSQGSLVQLLRGDGKATGEVVKTAKTLADGFAKGDLQAAMDHLDNQQAALDKALEKLDDMQSQLDSAQGEHTAAEQKKYQREIDSKLDALVAKQGTVARSKDVIRAWVDQNAPQGELDLQMPQAPEPAPAAPVEPAPAAAPATYTPPVVATAPQQVREMPGLFPEPQPVAQPAAQTQLAQNLANEAADESIKTNPTKERAAILKTVLDDPTTRRPAARFLAELRRKGHKADLTADEAQALADHEQYLDDITLGVPERGAAAEPAPQPTLIKPRPAPAARPEREFQLEQPTEEGLRRKAAAEDKRERKAAREPDMPAGPANGDLFDTKDAVKRRAETHSASMGSSMREWFNKGVQDALGDTVTPPEGKSRSKWFEQGRAFARSEQEHQATDRGEPAPAAVAAEPDAAEVTPADREAFDTRLEYSLEGKSILNKDYQQIKVLADQGNTSIKDLDAMLDAAIQQRENIRKGAFKGTSAQKEFGKRTAQQDHDIKVRKMEVRLRQILNRMGLADVPLEMVSKIYLQVAYNQDASGVYDWEADPDGFRHLIEVAMDADNPELTVAHEGIHALRMLNLFTPAEWSRLEAAARKNPLWAEAKRLYGEDQTDAAIAEEVIAESYARWADDRSKTDPLSKIFTKIDKFLRALKAFFTGEPDLYEMIQRGDIGNRPRGEPRWRQSLAERDQPGPSYSLFDPKKLPEPLQAPAITVKGALAKGGLWTMFTEDVANMAAKVLPSAKRFIELNSRSHALGRKFEERLSDIKHQFEALPDKIKGNGKGSLNDFLYSSRMTQGWGFQPSYLKPVKIDPAMKAKFDALPKAAQDVVKMIYRYNYDARRELLVATVGAVNAEFDPQIAEAATPEEKAKLQQQKDAALKHFSRLHSAADNLPYSPLKRSGNWVVVGMSKEYAEAKDAGDAAAMADMRASPDHYWVNFYDTEGEAAKAKERVATKYAVTQDFERSSVTDQQIGGKELYVAFNTLREKIAKQVTADPKDEVAKKLYHLATDLYLHSLADTSARKAELKADLVDARDPVTGEAIDMMKAFVTRGQATTHFVAAMSNSSEMQKALDAMEKEAGATGEGRKERERFRDELMWRYVHNLNRKPNRLIDGASRAVSMYNLLLSPAYYATNATQPWVLSMPALAGKVGYGKALGALAQAYKDVGPLISAASATERMRLNGLPADVKDVIQYLLDRGRLDAGLAQELGSWEANGNGVLPKAWNKADRILRYLPQNIETVNRVTTGIAAYRSGKASGMSETEAREFASKLIYDTHGDYSGFNEPRVMAQLGGFGKIALQFRKFQVIMASHMAKMVHNSLKGASPEEKWMARKALAFTLAHVAAVSGAVGMPGAALLGAVVQAVLGALDGDDKDYEDWEHSLRAWLKANAPGWFGDLLYKGAPYALTHVDLSSRLGMSEMLSVAPYSDAGQALSSRDDLFKTIGKIGSGALGGVVARAADANQYMQAGDTYRAIESVMPNGVLQGAMKANRLATRGVETKSGDRLIKPEEIDTVSIVAAALGLQSKKMADQSEARSYTFEKDAHYKAITTQLKNRYTRAARAGDGAKLAEIRAEWNDLQATRVRDGMSKQPLSTLLRAPAAQTKREKNVAGGVAYTKANKASVEETVN